MDANAAAHTSSMKGKAPHDGAVEMSSDSSNSATSHFDCDDEEMESAAPSEFFDPITFTLMQRPVTLLETGHTYELGSIQEWFSRGNHTCPLTNIPLHDKVAELNTDLLHAIAAWRLSQGIWSDGQSIVPLSAQVSRQAFRFHEETYWSPPTASDLHRHEHEITTAAIHVMPLLGPLVTSQMKPVKTATNYWTFNHGPSEGGVHCYVAGRTSDFGDKGAKWVAQLLRPRPNPDGSWTHNPSLVSLALQWDGIGAAGARAVASALQPHLQSDGQRTFNRALKELNFRRNPIGDGGAAALAAVFTPRLGSNGEWTHCTALASLDLSCCGVGEAGVKALAQALAPRQNQKNGDWVWPPLQALNLYGNPNVGSSGVAALMAALLAPVQSTAGVWVYNPHLSSLSVDVSGVDDEVLAAIGAAIAPRWNPASREWQLNTTLCKLELSNSIPIIHIGENFGLKNRIKSALRQPKYDLNQGRKQLGVYQSGGILQLVL